MPDRPQSGRATTARSSCAIAHGEAARSRTGASTAGRSTPNCAARRRRQRTIAAGASCGSGSRGDRVEAAAGAVVLEGGSIDVNGAGTLLTTEECLLERGAGAQPGPDRASDYEAVFADYLGVAR